MKIPRNTPTFLSAWIMIVCLIALLFLLRHGHHTVLAQNKGLTFEPTGKRDPSDPRIVPASMGFTVIKQNGRPYIQWQISHTIKLGGLNNTKPKLEPGPAVEMLISATDARSYAETLRQVADQADDIAKGGSGLPPGFKPPPPPPPPILRR